MSERVILCKACSTNLEIEDDYWADLAGDAIDCPNCGAAIEVPRSPGSAAGMVVPVVEPVPVTGHKGRIICIIAGIVVLTAVVVLVLYLRS